MKTKMKTIIMTILLLIAVDASSQDRSYILDGVDTLNITNGGVNTIIKFAAIDAGSESDTLIVEEYFPDMRIGGTGGAWVRVGYRNSRTGDITQTLVVPSGGSVVGYVNSPNPHAIRFRQTSGGDTRLLWWLIR